ncbi:MAG: amidohydrolase family protein [Anaerolineales bacterium]|nr:amidohydrolase family protein [Anaerolineales bacterium]
MTASPDYDLVIHNGLIYDGGGGEPYPGGVAVQGDRLARVGPLGSARGRVELDADSLALAPGFINMLSWAGEALIADGRSQSDLRQGVTLEVMGEGWSEGPLTEHMRQEELARQGDIQHPIEWTTLRQYLDWLAARGVSCNVASFVGATTVRIHTLGYADRPATPAELEAMCNLVRAAMRAGAVGLASSLIYVPACFAPTSELIALARASAELGGLYISHLRSEGDRLLEGLEELLTIAREAPTRAEVYHLKAAGQTNWGKLDTVIARIEAARAEGLAVTADMYTYPAAATGLDAAMPPWAQEGGHAAWVARLKDPAMRARVLADMRAPAADWENLRLMAGSPENVLLVSFKNAALKPLTGQTLAQVAAPRGLSPEEAAIQLVIEDDSRVGTVYRLMSEDNVRRQVGLPWMSFGSDSASLAPEGVFLKSNPHPRAYGTFARVLGKYTRDEGALTLPQAVRQLSALPAANLRLKERGRLLPGHYADVVVFDPAAIQDHATFAQPHQYSTGVQHVLVNGVPVIRDGEHTNARPGRVLIGPGAAA